MAFGRGCRVSPGRWKWLILLALSSAGTASALADCAGSETELAGVQAELAQGRAERALARLAALTSEYPRCAPVALVLAEVHAMRGESREAERSFLRAGELAPDRPEPFFQLGVFYDGRQQHAKAAAQFRKVLALAPGDPQAYDYLGLSLEATGDFGRAEAAFRMGLARNRGPRRDPMLHYNYGRFLMKHGRTDEARKHLDEAVRLVPGVRAVQYERAKLAEKLGDLAAARSYAERALEIDDRGGVILDLQVHYLLARIYRALGEAELAARFTELSQRGEIPLSARRRSGR